MKGISTLCLVVLALLPAAAFPQDVLAVRPSGPILAENTLRLSIVFARPPARGVIDRLVLRRADGSVVYAPFDPLELWSPDRRILTVLFQPGRVKTGLIAHEMYGWALKEGEHVTLQLSGKSIASWRVGPADESPPMPERWLIEPPLAGTRQPLRIRLDGAIDAMDKDFVAIVDESGDRVAGSASLSAGEVIWSFVPRRRWRAGEYAVLVNAELEDPAGNRVDQAFEQHLNAPVVEVDRRLPFEIPSVRP